MKEIIVKSTKGEFKVLVDNENFEELNKYKWTINIVNKYTYVYRSFTINKKKKFIKMHRQIMNIENSKILVDHINHNTLDNRKENLRLCNHSTNGMNRNVRKDSTCKYLGVRYMKDRNKYTAQIQGKHIGIFNTEIEAALAYDNKAKILFKEFANLNFK